MGTVRFIVIGVVGLVLALPFAAGFQFEKTFRNLPESLSQATPVELPLPMLPYCLPPLHPPTRKRVC